MIIDIKKSPVAYKRFRVAMDNGKTYDFGLSSGSTYIDHKDKILRAAYIKRHLGNETEKKLIDNLVPSPALFSAQLLWSILDASSTSLEKNIKLLNAAWKSKHLKKKNNN